MNNCRHTPKRLAQALYCVIVHTHLRPVPVSKKSFQARTLLELGVEAGTHSLDLWAADSRACNDA